MMFIGFAVVNLGVSAWAHYTPSPSNPFLAYASVFPGQPASAVEAMAFSCRETYAYYHHPEEMYCTFTPTADVFSYVEVVVYGSNISKITFTMRDISLQVGDLMNFLEMPAVHRSHNVEYFFLPESLVIARTIDHIGQSFLLARVWSISFTSL
jgi:hypothetical protein